MIDLSSLIAPQETLNEVGGKWFSIQWSPDPRNGERYNIGVAVVDGNGRSGVKLLDNYSRLECVFGKDSNVSFHVELACQVVESYLEDAVFDSSMAIGGFSQIKFEERGYVKGNSLAEAAERLYWEMVPLGREQIRASRAASISRAKVSRGVKSILRGRVAKVSELMPSNPYLNPRDTKKKIYLPVRGRGVVATIASARVATEHTAKLNVYEAQQDISIANSEGLGKFRLMHLLLPDDHAEGNGSSDIDNQIDSVSFVLKKEGVKLVTHNSEKEIADAVYEDYVNAA